MPTAKEQIVSLGIQFMGISDPLPFDEARMASFISAMIPVEMVVTKDDIKEACAVLGNTYLYINTPRLVTELTARISARETQAQSKIKSAIFILGSLFLGWVIYKKR